MHMPLLRMTGLGSRPTIALDIAVAESLGSHPTMASAAAAASLGLCPRMAPHVRLTVVDVAASGLNLGSLPKMVSKVSATAVLLGSLP